MTDNEIIKAIEICAQNSVTRHNGLTYQGMPLHFLFEEILGFVNRQKAEIEMLEKNLDEKNEELDSVYDDLADSVETTAVIKAEAVKEFAERLKDKISFTATLPDVYEDIDNLVKEFTEANNENK